MNIAIFVFTTSSEEFYREGFDVGALHYLVKPVDYVKVQDAMNRCIKSLGEIARQIEIKVGKNKIKVRLIDIQYIEVLGNACHIHTGKNKIVTYTPLNDCNSFDGHVLCDNEEFRSIKRNGDRGIGISSIKAVAEKYGGEPKFEIVDKNIFKVSMVLLAKE